MRQGSGINRSSSARGGEAMASSSNWLSGVNVVLVMAYGSLVFVLLFIFVKRQIMRFAMKSRRGPHVPVGHNAPKDLKEEIDIRLSRVQDIKYEPQLLADDDARLLQLETQGNQRSKHEVGALSDNISQQPKT